MIKVGVADFREHEFEHIRKFVPDGAQLFPTWAEQQIELEKRSADSVAKALLPCQWF